MLGLWLVFVLMVFVLAPLLHTKFEQQARREPASTLRRRKERAGSAVRLCSLYRDVPDVAANRIPRRVRDETRHWCGFTK
jgi:hypothetical protein